LDILELECKKEDVGERLKGAAYPEELFSSGERCRGEERA